jgi:putative addiction module killer protein
MEAIPRIIEIYQTAAGKKPYRFWLDSQTINVQSMVNVRLKRVEKGLLGDHHSEGGGVWALIFDDGPGIRVFYGLTDRQKMVLLLVGGNKKRQNKDIQQAIAFWGDFKKNDSLKDKS